jgi:predicted N-acetyltransferase YhbS
MELAGGLVLRTARESELDQIGALLAERGEEVDAEDLRLVAEDPDEGLDSILVVVDGDRVVSTATLLRETVTIAAAPGDDGIAVPAAQVELVATDRSVEGRGLVRALMSEAHRRSAARGDLLQVMIGIPFFYRQFGYSYTMPMPLPWTVRDRPAAPPDLTVRPATSHDIEAMAALQHRAQSAATVRMPHSAGCWRWIVERSGSDQLVAERGGVLVATGRQSPSGDGSVLAELAGEADGILALVAAARATSDELTVVERPGAGWPPVLGSVADPPSEPERDREWYYARVPELAPLLDQLRPVLLERFRAAGLRGRHEVLLSSWRSHVRFTIDEDAMSAVTPGGPEQAPIWQGGAGIPPDALAPLLLGPFGATGLETRLPDVVLGSPRELLSVLFPPQSADLLTFYVPW